MMIKRIGVSSSSFLNNKNESNQKASFVGVSRPYASDSFAKNNVSFKGLDLEPTYSMDTFYRKYPEDMKILEQLGSGPETVCRRSSILNYHHVGMKEMLRDGKKTVKFYNAFLDISLRFAKVKEQSKALPSKAIILKQSRDALQQHMPLPSDIDKKLLNEFNIAYTAIRPQLAAATAPSAKKPSQSRQPISNNSVSEQIARIEKDFNLDSSIEIEEMKAVLRNSDDKVSLEQASRGLVRGNHFADVKDFMMVIKPEPSGKLSKTDNLIVLNMASELAKLNEIDSVVSDFVGGLLKNPSISDSVKKVIKFAVR